MKEFYGWLAGWHLGVVGIVLASFLYATEQRKIAKANNATPAIRILFYDGIRSAITGYMTYTAATFLTPLEPTSAWGIAIAVAFMGPTWIRRVGDVGVDLIIKRGGQ